MENASRSAPIDPDRLLLGPTEARDALGAGIVLEESKTQGQIQHMGQVLGTTAISSAFRSYAGRALNEEDSVPLQVGLMALVFADDRIVRHTFEQVARASHMRTKLGATDVSVETVAGANGLVSYWCYLSLGPVLIIATLDTLDPQRVSMTEFRSLVTRSSEHLERALHT